MAVPRTFDLVFVLTVLYVCCVAGEPSGRILEGSDATTGQYPWVVSVRVDSAHIAVGSIISNSHILTSGHGLSQLASIPIAASRVSVRVGSINQYAAGQIVYVQSITIHPSYGNFLHDIAIITLSKPLTFTEKITSIPVASNVTDEQLVDGKEVSVTGWGLQLSGASPYKLQKITLKVLASEQCEYEAGYGYDSVLCLQHGVNQGISRGDDGAGVVYNKVLVGVASFFFGGGGTKFPDVTARVAYYDKWIKDVVSEKLI
ncbi:chymotrypsin-1-like [Eurosta solidaginis]|uniref:chymotrypsin-1-like n=1 Tax=Eurosta solidaginis TaxID=178769 RepID=UPI00353149A4